MKSDEELKLLTEPIVEIYQEIEHDLLLKIASFLNSNDDVTIKNSLDWYFTKLEEMGALNNESIKILSEYTNKSEKQIKKAIKEAGYGSISENRLNVLNEKGFTDISWDDLLNSTIINNAINTSFKETQEVFKMINTKALENTKKTYMNALNQARLEITTGIYDYNTSITRAIEKMVDNGISGATYQRKDGTIYNMTLESVVRRDMLTAIYQSFNTGSEANAKVIGAEYYEVSSHLGARLGDGKNPISNHYEWQGKVYKIHGSDDKYDNFYEKTGYGDILGLSGVNCRHKFWAFFPGIDKPSQQEYDSEENRKKVELQNKQRACERKIRKMRTKQDIFKQLGDSENYQKWKNKEKEFMVKYNKFLEDNNLHRDYYRERVVNKNVAKNKKELYNLSDIDVPNFMKEKSVTQLKKQLKEIVSDKLYKYANIPIERHNMNISYYSNIDKKIYLGSKSDVYELIHELGHRYDIETNLYKNKDFLKTIESKFSKYKKTDFQLKKHKNQNGKEIKYYVLKDSNEFLSRYQTRIYDGGFDFFGKVRVNYAREYFTEGLKYYYKNPILLKEKDIKLYNFIKYIMED